MSYWLRQAVVMLAIVALALVGYWAFDNWQKRSQFKAIAELVGEGTTQLRAALSAPPSKENIVGVEAAIERLQGARVSRQIAFAGAADTYLAGARTIMLRRTDAERIAQARRVFARCDARVAGDGAPEGAVLLDQLLHPGFGTGGRGTQLAASVDLPLP